MKLTDFTDYSLRTLIYLASAPQRRATIAEVAQAFGVSENHLVKVVHFLGKHGWVETLRGKGGGMLLAREPRDVQLGKVVRDTEGAARLAECFAADGGACAIDGACRLKGVLQEAADAFYDTLDRYSLADITRNREKLGRILMIRAA